MIDKTYKSDIPRRSVIGNIMPDNDQYDPYSLCYIERYMPNLSQSAIIFRSLLKQIYNYVEQVRIDSN